MSTSKRPSIFSHFSSSDSASIKSKSSVNSLQPLLQKAQQKASRTPRVKDDKHFNFNISWPHSTADAGAAN